jgi:membrane protease YdiL (CAAX protease family)
MSGLAEEQTDAVPSCGACGEALLPNAKFCTGCGARLEPATVETDPFRTRALREVMFLYGAILAVSFTVRAWDDIPTYLYLALGDGLLTAVTIALAAMQWTRIKPLLSLRGLSPGLAAIVTVLSVAAAVVVNTIIPQINQSLYGEDFYYYLAYLDTFNPIVVLLLSVAVQPAVFEELGFRGVIYNNLYKLSGEATAYWVTALLFAIIHLSFISLFWMVPFALALGWLRIRFNTLWYGIVAHFFFNLTSCVYELNEFGEINLW